MARYLYCCLLALAAIAFASSVANVAEARGGRGGNMMVCNTNPAPAQATQQNLLQTTATKVLDPAPLAKHEPTFLVKTKTGVDLKALAAINKRPAVNAEADKAIEFAAK